MIDDKFRINYKSVPLATYETATGSEYNDTSLHNHYEFEILLITGGSSSVRINDTFYSVEEGDMIFVNPFEIHSVIADREKPYSHCCVCFDYMLIIDKKVTDAFRTKNLHIMPVVKSTDIAQPFLKKCFLDIMKLYEEGGEYSDTQIMAYLSLMFVHLLKNNLTKKKPPMTESTAFCASVMAYVKSHYRENITSGQLAEAISHNHSYFCRKFAKNFGQSFSEYLTLYRLSVSKKYLEEGMENISKIAFLCGFSSHTYFSRCFKKYVGILPSEYKNPNRKGNL